MIVNMSINISVEESRSLKKALKAAICALEDKVKLSGKGIEKSQLIQSYLEIEKFEGLL